MEIFLNKNHQILHSVTPSAVGITGIRPTSGAVILIIPVASQFTFQIAQVVTFCDVYPWWSVVTWLCSMACQEELESSLERPLDPFEKVQDTVEDACHGCNSFAQICTHTFINTPTVIFIQIKSTLTCSICDLALLVVLQAY
jgi:hypothetical protein